MKKTNIGIIGAGGRGSGFLKRLVSVYSDQANVIGVADPNPVRAKAMMKSAEANCELYADAKDLLKLKDLDAVYITTPDYLHEELAVAALKAGKHVFVDKPLATTVKGCLNIVRAAKRSKRIIYMGFNMRFDPVVQKLKKLVEDGTAGNVFSIEAQEFYNGGRTYMARWNRLKKFSGGLWIHKGSHDFDVINWLMGKHPTRVSAFANVSTLHPKGLPFELKKGETFGPRCGECPQAHRCPDRFGISEETYGKEAIKADGYVRDTCIYLSEKDTHDQGVSIVEFEGGQTAIHSEYFVTSVTNRLYTLVGDRATIKGDVSNTKVVVHPRWSQDVITYDISRGSGGHGGADPVMTQNFLRVLRGEEEPLSDVIDGVWSVAEGEAAEISRAEHRMVEIRELLNPKSPLLK